MAAAAIALLRLLAFLALLRLLVFPVAPAAAAAAAGPDPAPSTEAAAAAQLRGQLRELQVGVKALSTGAARKKVPRQAPSGPSPTHNTVGLAGTTGRVEVAVGRLSRRHGRRRLRHLDEPAASSR